MLLKNEQKVIIPVKYFIKYMFRNTCSATHKIIPRFISQSGEERKFFFSQDSKQILLEKMQWIIQAEAVSELLYFHKSREFQSLW